MERKNCRLSVKYQARMDATEGKLPSSFSNYTLYFHSLVVVPTDAGKLRTYTEEKKNNE